MLMNMLIDQTTNKYTKRVCVSMKHESSIEVTIESLWILFKMSEECVCVDDNSTVVH